jgi:hypothetical protein
MNTGMEEPRKILTVEELLQQCLEVPEELRKTQPVSVCWNDPSRGRVFDALPARGVMYGEPMGVQVWLGFLELKQTEPK